MSYLTILIKKKKTAQANIFGCLSNIQFHFFFDNKTFS